MSSIPASAQFFIDGLNKIKNIKFKWGEKSRKAHLELDKKRKVLPEPCSKKMKDLFQTMLDKVDYEKLSTLVSMEFYNMDIMNTMKCLIHSVLESEQDFIDYIKNPNVLGIGGSKQDTLLVFFSALMNGKNRVLAFKYDGEDTLEEGMTGLLALNSLRSVIPTFSWIYGFTKCNLPIFKKENNKYQIVMACNHTVEFNNKDYIGMISEYIEGPTLEDYTKAPSDIRVKETNGKELLSAILTLLYSLKYANQRFEYVHWDLHTKNVLMRKLQNKDSYIYLPDSDEYLWVGDHLATIIDYGFSSFRDKDGEIISRFQRPDLGINPEVSHSPLNDFLKLINGLLYITANNHNKFPSKESNEKLNAVKRLYTMFTGIQNMNDMVEFYKMIAPVYHIFPNHSSTYNIDKFTKYTIDDLIQEIKNMDKTLVVKKKPSVVLSCEKSICLSEDMIESVVMTKSQILTMKEASQMIRRTKGLESSDDRKKLERFVVNYLDELFLKMDKYENVKPEVQLNMIYLFNDLRLIDQALVKLEEIAFKLKDKKLENRIESYKKTLNEWTDIFRSSAIESLDKYDDVLIDKLYGPMKQKFNLVSTLKDNIKSGKGRAKKEDEEEMDIVDITESPIQYSKKKSPQRKQTSSRGKEEVEEGEILEITDSPIMTTYKPPQIFIPGSTRKTPSSRKTLEKMYQDFESTIPLEESMRQMTLGPVMEAEKSTKKRKSESPKSREYNFVVNLEDYERPLMGKKGKFIKTNLNKTKIENMYQFILSNKKIIDGNSQLKTDIIRKAEELKVIDNKYEKLIDQFISRLRI
jgi:hypothetical protein